MHHAVSSYVYFCIKYKSCFYVCVMWHGYDLMTQHTASGKPFNGMNFSSMPCLKINNYIIMMLLYSTRWVKNMLLYKLDQNIGNNL